MTTAAWSAHLDGRRDGHFQELLELLRIPSISTDPAHADDVAAAADWVARRLRAAGVPEVDIVQTSGHPHVVARWHAAPGKPTVLIYGHFDVQPVDPIELWETPPFEPTIRDGDLYARGAADMKGNLVTVIQAVEALARADGAPPVNLTFLFEGEEEIGSPTLPGLVAAERGKLACDVALSADGGMGGPRLPVLLVALKGICGMQIDVTTSSTDLHSGSYGAAAPNAVQALVQLAATFHTADGRVAVEGFYDAVRELTEEERAEIAAVPTSDDEFMREAGIHGLWGEPGYSVLERRWARPTLDMNGIHGGFQGDGVKTVTPAQAHLKITCRLVVDQDPAQILDLLERHVEKHAPAGVRVSVDRAGTRAMPYAIRRGNPALTTLGEVLTEVYGVAPVVARSGGSVPVTEVFQRELGVDTVTLGFGMPGSRAHAPNEWYPVEQFDFARRTYAAYLEALGR